MKKIASLLLIVVFVLSMGTAAFAAEDPTALGGTGRNGSTLGEGTAMHGRNSLADGHQGARGSRSGVQVIDDDYDGHYAADDMAPVDDIVSIAPRLNFINDNTVRILNGEMFLVLDGRIVLPEHMLIPNTEYLFQIYYNRNGLNEDGYIDHNINTPVSASPELVPLTEESLSGATGNTTANARLRLRSGRGTTTIGRSELRTRGTGTARTYELMLDTRASYNTRQTDVTFTLLTSGVLPAPVVVTPEDAGATPPIPNDIYSASLAQSILSFVVGWPRMTDEDVDSYAEGDTVTISNEYPVIMRRQIERLVRNHNYRPIHLAFEDGSWEYTGRMSGMSDTNFFTTQDVVPSLMNRFDQDFKFLSLPAGVTFPTNGELRIDVSDVSDDWNRIYTYLYRNGNLTPITTSYDSLDDMIYFRTNFLGSFVMTDVEITDLALIAQPEEPEVQEPEEPEIPDTQNPPMGVAMGMSGTGLLVGLGSASLLGAGALVTRRRKK